MFKNLLLMSTLAFVLASSAPTNEAAEGKYIHIAILSAIILGGYYQLHLYCALCHAWNYVLQSEVSPA